MVPSEKKPSLQEILRRRQQEEFVGREEQLAFFSRNLRWGIDDPRRRFVINVSGQGGVGKTWLLRRFREIAEEASTVTACTDENEDDVPGVMGCIAEQFEAQGHSLKTFAEQYKIYRQRRQEIETDPDAPQGFPAFLGRTVAKGGLRLARRVPIGGVVADFVDEEAFASLAGDFASYVARKIRNKNEVRLVLEPVEVLTPLFLADLRDVAEKHCLALFFDTYERTSDFLDPWLRDLMEGRHGDVPVDILLVVAGRDELDRNHWAPYEGLLARLPLDPFTEEKAGDYLTRKGITDERVVEVILGLSGRLPLLVATLAAESPDDPEKVGDPSGEAVERFLKWVENPKQRQVALDAAIPRRLNRDVLAVLVGEEEANALFGWLRGMPFVERRGDGWAYHDVVRTQMLRYKRQEAPKGWADLHGRLAEYYEGLRDGLGLDEEASRKDETWQGYALEALYHRLCQAPQAQLPVALNGFLAALEAQLSFARRWAGTVGDAGEDAGVTSLHQWGRRLVEGVKDYGEGRYQEAAEMFSALLEQGDLRVQWRALALASRGKTYGRIGRYEESLADLNQALELDPNLTWAIVHRGITYRDMGRYEEALADFDAALELGVDRGWVFANRGVACQLMERYEEALVDLDRAIKLRSDMVWPIASRGITYRDMERYEEALADFNQVLQLDPNLAWAIIYRGITYRDMRRYEEALTDFNRVREPDSDLGWALANRGVTYRLMGRYEEALADFDRAIELQPDLIWPIASRGATYLRMGRYEDALAEFDRIIELDPDDAFAIVHRGVTYWRVERYEEALADFNRAIELKPDNDWYLYDRALTLQTLGRSEEAQADLNAAIHYARQGYEKDPQDWTYTFNLALYHLAAGEAGEAEHLYQEALSGGAWRQYIREAARHLDDFLAIFPNHSQARAMRDLLQEHLQDEVERK